MPGGQMGLIRRALRAPQPLTGIRIDRCCRSAAIAAFLLTLAAAVCHGAAGASATLLPRSCRSPLEGPEARDPPFRLAGAKLPGVPPALGYSFHRLRQQRPALALLSSWTSPPQEYSETSVSGEWYIRGKQQVATTKDAADAAAKEAAARASEALGEADGPRAAAAFLRVWDGLRSGKWLSLHLSSNRIAILRTPSLYSLGRSFTYEGIWQIRGRPFLPPLLEIELGFPPEIPEIILVLSVPLASGPWVSQVPLAGHGKAGLSFSPFFPWKARQAGQVEIQPKTRKAAVDALFQ